MTGGHVQGDLLAPEDVVSLLIDDAQLEQKLKENPIQVKDKQKKKRVNKGIRIDAEGDASLEDLDKVANEAVDVEPSADPEKPKSSNRKRKTGEKQGKPKQKGAKANDTEITDSGFTPGNEFDGFSNNPDQQQRPKRPKRERPTKSVNEDIEPAFAAAPFVTLHQP